jgi:hypothetical protein
MENTEKVIEKPQYTHDCEDCVFLGRFENKDLYFCSQNQGKGISKMPTIISRFGNEPQNYISGLWLAENNHFLKEAHRRAKEKGLL